MATQQERETIEEYKTRQLEAKLKLAEISNKKKTTPSRRSGFFDIPKPRALKAPNVSFPLSKGQQLLNEMFSGREEPLWGTGNNLPVLNQTLTSGNGLINTGERTRRTGGMFGLR